MVRLPVCLVGKGFSMKSASLSCLQVLTAQIIHPTQQVQSLCSSSVMKVGVGVWGFFFSIFYLQDSQCVDKLYANLPGASVPLNVYSPWGGVNCHVKLTSVPGSLIRLTVTSFVIEPTDCVNDALTVYDALLPMRGRILHRWDCSWQEMHSILD